MTLSVQFMTMAAMAVMGIWIGLSVDTYGRFFYRGGRRRWNPVQIAGDLLFWFVQGLLVFFVLLSINEGDVRIYIFLALFCGYAAYKSLFQNLYRSLLEGIISTIRYILRLVKKTAVLFFLRPVQLLAKLVYTVLKMVIQGIIALLLFVWTILWVPLRWLFRLILPAVFLQWMENFFARIAGIPKSMKKLIDRMIAWFWPDK
ncbi:MAG TPA: spore cortex biosynthesis protein YabQ [Bacillales bacterium]|nr:spore cortex biosynthesis protein YabQ [Bacillales bacterium]